MMIMHIQPTSTNLFCIVAVLSMSRGVHSFTPLHATQQSQNIGYTSARYLRDSASPVFDRNLVSCNLGASPPRPSKGDFEYEELVAQMKAMRTAKLVSADLTTEKRRELQDYVLGILRKRASPVPLTEMVKSLPYTSWRLSYSTEAFSSSGLPPDATVRVEFLDDKTATYSLEFGEKTFGLKNLKAASSWACGTSEIAMDPTKAGVVTLTYDKITTDVFGFSNIGVGLFGMLKGRSNYIQSVYFDGTLWIEEGYSPDGEQFYNVYMNDA